MKTIHLSQIRRAMLRKGITRRTLTKHFRLNDDAIARALSGRRNSLLRKITHFVRTHPGKHVAVRPVRMDGMSEASRRFEGLLTEDAFGGTMSEAEPPVNVHLISLE